MVATEPVGFAPTCLPNSLKKSHFQREEAAAVLVNLRHDCLSLPGKPGAIPNTLRRLKEKELNCLLY